MEINLREINFFTLELGINESRRLRSDNLGNGSIVSDSEEFVLMQYTGLEDKNLKEIYEGDVVRFADKYIYEIIFNKCKFSKKSKYGEFDLYDDEEDIEGYKHYDLEIIGNIYENPELIG